MTVKSFNKAFGYLNGFHFWEDMKIVIMGICQFIALPLTTLFGGISELGAYWSALWAVFAALYTTWDIIHISLDPAYPFSKAHDAETGVEAAGSKKAVEAAAVFPTDRFTAVKLFHIKRLVIAFMVSAGFLINGLVFMGIDTVAGGFSVKFAVIFFALSNIFYYAAFLYKKGLKSNRLRHCCDILITSSAFAGIFTESYSESSGASVGTAMLISAAVILATSLICYRKCLKDAENTARNGEPTGGM